MHLRIGRFLLATTAALAVEAAAMVAYAGPSVELNVRIGDPPPPPAFVFEDEPEVILIPSSRVYYVPSLRFDLFRYGRYWYINNDGWWYRARAYRGPFVFIDYDKVPRSILKVPNKYHRHPLGGPPGKTGIHPGRGGDDDRPVKAIGKKKKRGRDRD